MKKNKKVVVLSGAGISAESGIPTFRDADGLWQGYDINKVASIEGWYENPELVLEFYNKRRREIKKVNPNAAHYALVDLEKKYDVTIVTQNVDNLHERAGSSHIIHLHGELTKVRSTGEESLVYLWEDDLNLGDKAEDGHQLRPHIVWFGESVPMIESAAEYCEEADIIIIIGTSMQVYPAAGLVQYARPDTEVFYVDRNPSYSYEMNFIKNLKIISEPASTGVPSLVESLMTK